MPKSDPTAEYIEHICSLYADVYDDRLEDCKPPAAGDTIRTPGKDWVPCKFRSAGKPFPLTAVNPFHTKR